MASITFPRNIKLNLAEPLDKRLVVADASARTSLDYVYEGLIVFEQDTKKLYVAVLESSNSTYTWREITSGTSTDIYIRGYYHNGEFYTTTAYTTLYPHDLQKVYIDLGSANYDFYHYEDNIGYKAVVPLATADLAGVAKLYSTHGQNTDGSMTQKAITDGVNSIKLGVVSVGDDNQDGVDEYALVLDLPWD